MSTMNIFSTIPSLAHVTVHVCSYYYHFSLWYDRYHIISVIPE